MGASAADRKTMPELPCFLCHEFEQAILRELKWLLLPYPYSRPDLASSNFH